MILSILLAAITGTTLINFFIWIVIAGVIFWLLQWMINYIGLPEPFAKVAKVVFAVIAVILVINALLVLVGKPFIVLW